jgi:hypothetical protein
MALKDVLSVIGAAVAEDAAGARFRRKVRNHPRLTAKERSDLLAIPDERIAIYAADRRAETADMLQWALPYAWRALSTLRFEGAGGSEEACVGRLTRLRPNRTHSVRELARRFVTHMSEDCPALAIVHPWLLELAEAERLEVASLYAADSPMGRPLRGGALEEFLSGTVEDILEARVVRAEGTAVLRTRHDLPAIRNALDVVGPGRLEADPTRPPYAPLNPPRHGAVARHPETLRPRWHNMSALEARLFERLRPGNAAPLLDVAAAHCEAARRAYGAMREETLLRGFLTTLAAWFERRYLLLAT